MTLEKRLAAWGMSGARAVCVLSWSFVVGCGNESPSPVPRAEPALHTKGPVAVLNVRVPFDPARAQLGEGLFKDRRLSSTGTLACVSCHDLERGGVDGLARSVGALGTPLAVNTPTVFNAALNFRQFWDGRAVTLEDQIDGPLLNADEMGSTWASVLDALDADPQVVRTFRAAYGRGPDRAAVKDALANFERSLATPDAPFDRYLAGDREAIGPAAVRGFALFTSYGCSACHQGQGLGGNMFQKFGVMGDYFADRGAPTQADQGRFNVTHDEADRHVFKVPSLRNVARTAPYFHDGSAPRLGDAVRVMGRYQLGRQLEDGDVEALVAFLEGLTGQYQGRPL